MYYLLEDNRIIEKEEKDRAYTKELPLELIVRIKDGITTYGKIKKQSENVYDLIDSEKDLVEIEGQIIMAKHISGDISKMSGISAIYKPNEKGDYIKVWEKKDEKM